MICERCSRDIYKSETCNYCNRKICFDCTKSSKRLSKTTRLVICKDCWSKMPSRKKYKSTTLASTQMKMPEREGFQERRPFERRPFTKRPPMHK
ncbi:Uncharacterised protein [uncultured archaeon]|nr:Uncharacterised protein [uncultured archaeon]